MNVLLIYFMGAVLSFGVAYTLSSSKYYVEDPRLPRKRLLIWAFFLSWIAILIGIKGFIRGFLRGGRDGG